MATEDPISIVRAKIARTKHGHRYTVEYRVWLDLRVRCLNPKNSFWDDYGGRGIKVCERWNRFENFLADMGKRPDGMTLDRIDVDGNYEPGNCRWATHKEQNRNKRNTRKISFNGETLSLIEWAERTNMRFATLASRYDHGWSAERILLTPIKRRFPRPHLRS